jgi:pilus assembly protein Flp/PilA
MNRLREFVLDESGAAAVEYGMLVALIAAVVIGAVVTLGKDIRTAFDAIVTVLGVNKPQTT